MTNSKATSNISQNQVRHSFNYSSGELYWRNPVSRRVRVNSRCGRADSRWYLQTRLNGKLLFNHCIIFLYFKGYLPEIVDHIDGDRTSNKIDNLRAATKAQNTHNSKLSSANKSGVKGVRWHKRKKIWIAQIQNNYTIHMIGYFKYLTQAEKAIVSTRERLHGDLCNHG